MRFSEWGALRRALISVKDIRVEPSDFRRAVGRGSFGVQGGQRERDIGLGIEQVSCSSALHIGLLTIAFAV